ncbi:metal-dependent hydrolase [Paenibacillus sp.]|uniref:metal-dependent hydrolase n=1 Tax=Paenibacillus sp. TaxID=58172 RepID=UPI002D37A8D5|nr:metal-dependent hydrolase [Paenibacillus sp.]HZG87629.1 metal-dependent hydrolase [Paenibacillus sp.]
MRITFLGHSGLLVEAGGKRVAIDPFLTGNPMAAMRAEQLKVDGVVLTHGHGDHASDAAKIAAECGCRIVAAVELAGILARKGVQTVGMNLGGTYEWDGIRVKLTPALHSSSYEDGDQVLYAGPACGALLTIGGKTLYHTGDTALFSDLKLIGERHRIDVAALPIGDHFTMGPDDALDAAAWIGAKRVIPLHYDTFPMIRQDGAAFAARLAERGIDGYPLKPGETLTIE